MDNLDKDNCNKIGDWGLGIGDWPIPNPQSPLNKSFRKNLKSIKKVFF